MWELVGAGSLLIHPPRSACSSLVDWSSAVGHWQVTGPCLGIWSLSLSLNVLLEQVCSQVTGHSNFVMWDSAVQPVPGGQLRVTFGTNV